MVEKEIIATGNLNGGHIHNYSYGIVSPYCKTDLSTWKTESIEMLETNVEEQSYETYSYRWVILGLFMLNAIMTQINWITFAPIATELEGDLHTTEAFILLLTASYMIAYVPVNFPATWALDKYGLKWGTGFGVILTGVFSMVRWLGRSNLTLLMIGQIMMAIGQPFVLNSFTKVAINWFPEEEKTAAAGLGTVSLLLGVIIGMIATPLLYASAGIGTVLLIYGLISFVAMGLYIIFVRNTPPSPPSAEAGSQAFDFKGFKTLFKNRNFLILLAMVFIGLGSFNAISTEIDSIFTQFSSRTDASGIIGGVIVIGGIFGAGILSAISDKIHKRKIFLILAMAVSIPMTWVLPSIANYTTVLVLAFIFGFFLVSALPIALIFAAEVTYPVSEEASNGIMMTLGQVAGLLLLISFHMYIITILFIVGTLMSFLLEDINQAAPAVA